MTCRLPSSSPIGPQPSPTVPCWWCRESPTGRPGFTPDRSPELRRAGCRRVPAHRGEELGLAELDLDSFEVLRIEAGTPVFGRDVTERNLPQEIGRDDRAINFVKGCYLGQETVARIDALGHVNQLLKGLLLDSSAPMPPSRCDARGRGKARGLRDLVGHLSRLGNARSPWP